MQVFILLYKRRIRSSSQSQVGSFRILTGWNKDLVFIIFHTKQPVKKGKVFVYTQHYITTKKQNRGKLRGMETTYKYKRERELFAVSLQHHYQHNIKRDEVMREKKIVWCIYSLSLLSTFSFHFSVGSVCSVYGISLLHSANEEIITSVLTS